MFIKVTNHWLTSPSNSNSFRCLVQAGPNMLSSEFLVFRNFWSFWMEASHGLVVHPSHWKMINDDAEFPNHWRKTRKNTMKIYLHDVIIKLTVDENHQCSWSQIIFVGPLGFIIKRKQIPQFAWWNPHGIFHPFSSAVRWTSVGTATSGLRGGGVAHRGCSVLVGLEHEFYFP